MYGVVIEGLEVINTFEQMGRKIPISARQAINATLLRGRTASGRRIRLQAAFPARYLSGADGRLDISRKATTDKLEGAIVGRQRATSLARFASSPLRGGAIRVTVKPGRTRVLKRAFFTGLKAGSGALGNIGLAVRTSGEKPRAAYRPKKLGKNLWLLYGPSVDQVFRSVAEEVSPELAIFLEAEFTRLMALDR